MQKYRAVPNLILCLVILATLMTPCFAVLDPPVQEGNEPVPVHTVATQSVECTRSLSDGTLVEQMDADGTYHFFCPEDCTPEDILNYFLYYYDLDEDNFAFNFFAPETGEYCSFNDTTFMKAASTYKLPLNMYYYQLQAEGTYTGDSWVGGTTLDEAHYLSLVWSDNDVSEAMIYELGDFYTYKQLMNEQYGYFDEEDLPEDYWSGNYYCTRFMINTLYQLYLRMNEFPEMLEYMLEACPDDYLDRYSGDVPVAHKEGYFEEYIHDVGIVFAESPFLIAVYTRDMPSDYDALEVIGRINAAFISYQSLAVERLEQEAEAAAAAEAEEASAGEEAEDSGDSGVKQSLADLLTQTPEPVNSAVPSPQPTENTEALNNGPLRTQVSSPDLYQTATVGIIVVVILLVLICLIAFLVRMFRKR